MLIRGRDIPCGCDTRKDTIGEQWFFNGAILTGSAVVLLLSRGGSVSTKTRNILLIALAGATIAVLSDAIIRPALKPR